MKSMWLAPLILVTGLSRPACCEPIATAVGASRNEFYAGRVVWGTTRDEDHDYGAWTLPASAAVYLGIYEPQIGYTLRTDPQSGLVLAAECTWFSVPPGAVCIWDDEPGSIWMTANLAATFDPATMTWWRAHASGVPAGMTGPTAARLIDGVWVIPMTKRVDQSDRWWHWLGRPEPWYNHPEWFAPLPVWLGVPNTDSATLRVALSETHADFALEIHTQPPLHADLDRDGAVGAVDLFCFLAEWFAGRAAGDWDGVGGCQVPDVFAFLTEWFGS